MVGILQVLVEVVGEGEGEFEPGGVGGEDAGGEAAEAGVLAAAAAVSTRAWARWRASRYWIGPWP